MEIGAIYDYDNIIILDGNTLEPRIDQEIDTSVLLFAELKPDNPGIEILVKLRYLDELLILARIFHK